MKHYSPAYIQVLPMHYASVFIIRIVMHYANISKLLCRREQVLFAAEDHFSDTNCLCNFCSPFYPLLFTFMRGKIIKCSQFHQTAASPLRQTEIQNSTEEIYILWSAELFLPQFSS
jgi:hypothetical protein